MLADTTNNLIRLFPLDFGHTKEDNVSVSPPTGTANALVNLVGNEWIEIDSSQAWFWTDEWQEGERQVEEYIRDENVQSFDSIEEFLRDLQD